MRLGVLGGSNVAALYQVSGPELLRADYRSVARFDVGAAIELGGKGSLGLRLEPSYTGRGSKYSDPPCTCLRPIGYVSADNDLRLSYVDLPVLLVRSLAHGSVRPQLVAGVVGSYLTNATLRRAGVVSNLTYAYRRWDAGVVVGAGLGIDRGRGRLLVEVRYGLGLVTVDEASSRNRGLQLLAGFTASVGRP